jgi:ABC-type multidrug transport system ATPase subunit
MDHAQCRFYLVSDGKFVPLTAADGKPAAEAVFKNWSVSFQNDGVSLTANRDGIKIDQKTVTAGQPVVLSHRMLIQEPEKQAYIFLDRDDPALDSPDDLNRYALAMLVRGAEESRTLGVAPHDIDSFPNLPGRVALSPGQNIIGRDRKSNVFLDSPMVSRQHAAVDWDGSKCTLTDLQSFNGTFLEGERLGKPTALCTGDRIEIGPFRLVFGGDHFVLATVGAAELTVDGVSYSVQAREGQKTIVRNVHLAIRPREFVAVMGSSGCGKSILSKLLIGRLHPSTGSVYLDRENLHSNFAAFQRRIAYVPQHDILHDTLTLNQTLDYAARLRMPADLSDEERQKEIDRTLEQVGLENHRTTPVSRLSGGQTRRASLAIELLSRPELLLLDEVTTGLDEEIDGELMVLFKNLATTSGVTIVMVTHNLGSVLEQCDRMVVLTPIDSEGGGGQLAFFGTPEEALKHFEVKSLGKIYKKLHKPPSTDWGADFVKNDIYERHVRQRTPIVLSNRASTASAATTFNVTKWLQQTWLLLSRSIVVKRGQWSWIALMFAQAVGLAIMLSWLFGDLTNVKLTADEDKAFKDVSKKQFQESIKAFVKPHELPINLDELNDLDAFAKLIPDKIIPREEFAKRQSEYEHQNYAKWVSQKRGSLLIRMTVSIVMCALWLGCNNASSEIVRERRIFEAEREVGIQSAAYLTAKILLMGAIVVAQTTILLLGVRWGTGYDGPLFWQLAVLWTTAGVGVTIGLAISAWANSNEVSTALVPIAIIPQIMFAGTLVPLTGEKQFLAEWFAPMHWGYRGLVHLLHFEEQDRELLRMVGALPAYPDSDGQRAFAMLAIHGAFFLVVAWIGLVGSDRLRAWWRFSKS